MEHFNSFVSKMTIWEVQSPSNRDDGSGPLYRDWFRYQPAAQAFAKGQGVWGSDAKVCAVEENVLYWDGKYYVLGDEVRMHSPEEEECIITKALAKLTEEERQALRKSKRSGW